MATWWAPLAETFNDWSEHKDARLGAALAYYSVFSLGPLIVIAISIAGLAFGQEAVQGQVAGAIRGLLGDTGAQAVEAMLKGADRPREGMVATILGLGTLLFAAIGVVVQLKDALNTVWDVKSPPGKGLWRFARTYVLSLAGVLALGFLLLISLLLTAALSAVGKYIAPYLPEGALQIAGSAASFAVIGVLFAMMFKWLPDTRVEWRDVWLGAILTAALFELGKFVIGFYIGKQGLESTYGAADRGRADLDLLLGAARADGGRVHKSLCAALRLAKKQVELRCTCQGAEPRDARRALRRKLFGR